MKRLAFLAFLACGFVPQVQAQTVPVLTYHRFDTTQAKSATIVTTPIFAAQMDWLEANHIHVVPLHDVLAVAHGAVPTAPTVAISADDGWRSVYTEMYPIILRHRFPVTLFINPPMIGHGGAYLTWPMIAEMVKSGLVDVEAHTLTHPNFNTERGRRDPAAYAAYIDHEIAGSRAELSEHLGHPVDLLAWPFGIRDPTLEAAATKAGFVAAFALGSHAVTKGDPDMALPRYQIYDTDRDGRFGWIVAGHPRQKLQAKVTP